MECESHGSAYTDLEGSGEHLPVSGIRSVQHLADRVDLCFSRVRHGCRPMSGVHPTSETGVSQDVCRKDLWGGGVSSLSRLSGWRVVHESFDILERGQVEEGSDRPESFSEASLSGGALEVPA